MDYRELLEKYNLLLSENSRLIKENDRLKAQLVITKNKPSENRIAVSTTEKSMLDDEPTDSTSFSAVNTSDSISKIKLFMSLFKGRDDVYAQKWENKKDKIRNLIPLFCWRCFCGFYNNFFCLSSYFLFCFFSFSGHSF